MNRLLRSTVVLRILALILACILWLTVNAPSGSTNGSNQEGIPEKFSFPIHVQVGPDMVVSSQSTTTAIIQVRSAVWTVVSLSSQMGNVHLIADAENLNPGQHTLPVLIMGMPNIGGNSVTVSPATLLVVLDKKVTAMKPVKILLHGRPVKSAYIGNISVDNPMVEVTGASSAVSRVTEVVGSVSVTGANSFLFRTVQLTAVDANGRPVGNVTVAPGIANVTIPVQMLIQKMSVLPQIVGQPGDGFAVSGVQLNVASVDLYGPLSTSLPLQTIMVPVDVTGMQASGTVSVHIPPLSGVNMVAPASVTAQVTIEPSSTSLFTDLPVQVINLPSGMTAVLPTSPKVSVRVVGPQSVVSMMSAQSITVYVDGSGLKQGDTIASIRVQLPNWVSASQVTMDKVPIQVS